MQQKGPPLRRAFLLLMFAAYYSNPLLAELNHPTDPLGERGKVALPERAC